MSAIIKIKIVFRNISKYEHLIPLGLFLIIGGLSAYLLGQDQNWDLYNYHFYNAYALFHGRIFMDFAPAGIQTYSNPLLDTFSFIFINNFKPVIEGIALGVIQSINAFIIFELCLLLIDFSGIKKYYRYIISFLIAITCFFGSGNIGEIGNNMGDNIAGIFVLGSILAFFYYKKNLTEIYLRNTSYVLMGIASGLKLTNLIYVIPLLLIGLLDIQEFKKYIKNNARNIIYLLSGFLATYCFWGIYLYERFKNPFFPWFNKLFNSPYYPSVNFLDARFFPHSLKQWLLYPFYFTRKQTLVSEVPMQDFRIALFFIIVFIFALFIIYKFISKKKISNQRNIEIKLYIFILLSYILWEIKFSIYRYLIPIEMLSFLAVAIFLINNLRHKRIGLYITLLLIPFLFFNEFPMNWGRIPWKNSFFGIQMPYKSNRAVILMSGQQPESFLVQALSPTNPIIRIGSSLEANGATKTEINYIMNEIQKYKHMNYSFYAITSEITMSDDKSNYESLNINVNNCRIIKSYFQEKFYLCNAKFF